MVSSVYISFSFQWSLLNVAEVVSVKYITPILKVLPPSVNAAKGVIVSPAL